jgi:hypothetical protein
MYRPTDVAIDLATDAVYVVEQRNHRISKWDYTPGGFTFTLDGTWGSNGDGTSGVGAPIGDGGPTDNSLFFPTGIINDGTRLVVTDTFHNRVRTLALADGAFIDSIGQGGSGLTDFYHPAGIDHNIAIMVIADEGNRRAVSYDVAATPDNPAVLPAPNPLIFNRPHGVFFDNGPNTFNVTDSFHNVISRYNSLADTFIDQFGTPGTTGTDLFFTGSGHGTLTGNTGNAVADTRNNDIKTIAATTVGLTTGTTAGTGDGQLYWPESVRSFFDLEEYVLVANTLNNRVEAYTNVGTVLTFESNFGTP